MKRRPFFLRPIFLLLFALSLGIGSWTLLKSADVLMSYRTAKITRGSIRDAVTANGTLNPIELVTVGSQVSGQVQKVYVRVNDHVTKGQLLAEIDPSLPAAQLKQSQSNLETARIGYEQAERDLKRTRMLLEKDYVAKVDVEHAEQAYLSARNSFDSAKMQVEQNQVSLNYTKIYSPIEGDVIAASVTLGQTLAATYQTPDMFKIASDMAQMKIDVNLPESDIAKVKVGMPVTFTVDAFPDREFNGKVDTVNLNPNNQQGIVTYTIVVTVDNKDKVLFPGMTAYVNVVLSEKKDVLRVPAAALRFSPPQEQVSGLQVLLQSKARRASPINMLNNDEKTSTIYLLRHDVLAPVQVTTGATDETYVEVTGEGIAEGDSVVTGVMPGKH